MASNMIKQIMKEQGYEEIEGVFVQDKTGKMSFDEKVVLARQAKAQKLPKSRGFGRRKQRNV